MLFQQLENKLVQACKEIRRKCNEHHASTSRLRNKKLKIQLKFTVSLSVVHFPDSLLEITPALDLVFIIQSWAVF